MKNPQRKKNYMEFTISKVNTESTLKENENYQQNNKQLQKEQKNSAKYHSYCQNNSKIIQGVSLIESTNIDYIFIKDCQSISSQSQKSKKKRIKTVKTQPNEPKLYSSWKSSNNCLINSYQQCAENPYIQKYQQNQKYYNKKIQSLNNLKDKQDVKFKIQNSQKVLKSHTIENKYEQLYQNFTHLLKNSCINHYSEQAKYRQKSGKKYCSKCAIKMVQSGQYIQEASKVSYSEQIDSVLSFIQNANRSFFSQLNQSQSIYAQLLSQVHEKKKTIQTTFQSAIQQIKMFRSEDINYLNKLENCIKSELKSQVSKLTSHASRLQKINQQIEQFIVEQNKNQQNELQKVIRIQQSQRIREKINKLINYQGKQSLKCWQKHIQDQYQIKYKIEQALQSINNLKIINQKQIQYDQPVLQLDQRRKKHIERQRIKEHQKYLISEKNRYPFRDLFPQTPCR